MAKPYEFFKDPATSIPIFLFLLALILQPSVAPPPRAPSPHQTLENILKNDDVVEATYDSGITNTGQKYLTKGPAFTHARYQNRDSNRRERNKKRYGNPGSGREMQSGLGGLPRSCAAEIPCDISTHQVLIFAIRSVKASTYCHVYQTKETKYICNI